MRFRKLAVLSVFLVCCLVLCSCKHKPEFDPRHPDRADHAASRSDEDSAGQGVSADTAGQEDFSNLSSDDYTGDEPADLGKMEGDPSVVWTDFDVLPEMKNLPFSVISRHEESVYDGEVKTDETYNLGAVDAFRVQVDDIIFSQHSHEPCSAVMDRVMRGKDAQYYVSDYNADMFLQPDSDYIVNIKKNDGTGDLNYITLRFENKSGAMISAKDSLFVSVSVESAAEPNAWVFNGVSLSDFSGLDFDSLPGYFEACGFTQEPDDLVTPSFLSAGYIRSFPGTYKLDESDITYSCAFVMTDGAFYDSAKLAYADEQRGLYMPCTSLVFHIDPGTHAVSSVDIGVSCSYILMDYQGELPAGYMMSDSSASVSYEVISGDAGLPADIPDFYVPDTV